MMLLLRLVASLCCVLVFPHFTLAKNELVLLPSPFEHPERCGRDDVPRSAICDPSDRLKRSEKDIIEGSLNSLAHLGQGAIAVVDKLNQTEALQNETIASATEIVAKATYTAWGIGRGADDRGFLVFLSLGDRTVYISIGSGLEKYVAQDDLTSIISNMKVKLRAGEYSQAILVAVLEIKLLLSLSTADPLQVWNAGHVNRGEANEQLLAASSTSKGSGFFPPDMFNPNKQKPANFDDRDRRRNRGIPPSSTVTAGFAKMGQNGAKTFSGFQMGLQRLGGITLLIPLAALMGKVAYNQLEGKLAFEDVMADSNVYSSDMDDMIVTRVPARCPHCLTSLVLPDSSPSPLSLVPQPAVFTSALESIRNRISKTLWGGKNTCLAPACLPCGHVYCVNCIHAFFNKDNHGWWSKQGNNVWWGITNIFTTITDKTTGKTTMVEMPPTAVKKPKRRRGRDTVMSEFCRNCPVCTTMLSDWASTLNKIQADTELLGSLRSTAATLDDNSMIRVESLLARINRNKEISYAVSRLRKKYGIIATIDGGFIYEHDLEGGDNQWNTLPYNARRRRRHGSSQNDGMTITFGGQGRNLGDHTGSMNEASSTSQVSTSPTIRSSTATSITSSPSSSIAGKVLSKTNRTNRAEDISSSTSHRKSFESSGKMGTLSTSSFKNSNSDRISPPSKNEESKGGRGGGDSW